MKMVAATVEQNVLVHVSDISKDMLQTENRLWFRKLEGCYIERCHMCIDLNYGEGSSYKVFQLEKQSKRSYKMVQYITHTSDLPYMDFMRIKQRVVIKGKVDGQDGGPLNIEQPIVVQKKKLKKNRDYGIPSHLSGVLIKKT